MGANIQYPMRIWLLSIRIAPHRYNIGIKKQVYPSKAPPQRPNRAHLLLFKTSESLVDLGSRNPMGNSRILLLLLQWKADSTRRLNQSRVSMGLATASPLRRTTLCKAPIAAAAPTRSTSRWTQATPPPDSAKASPSTTPSP